MVLRPCALSPYSCPGPANHGRRVGNGAGVVKERRELYLVFQRAQAQLATDVALFCAQRLVRSGLEFQDRLCLLAEVTVGRRVGPLLVARGFVHASTLRSNQNSSPAVRQQR